MSKIKCEIRQLLSTGKCVCCGKNIERKSEDVCVIRAYKSQVYEMTVCQDCIIELNKIIKRENDDIN